LRGSGWKKNKKLMSPVSKRTDAGLLIKQAAGIPVTGSAKGNILDKWYIQKKAKWITYLYSLYQHFPLIRISPGHNVGHEIHGLYKKTRSVTN
jgi:hypothetical protein